MYFPLLFPLSYPTKNKIYFGRLLCDVIQHWQSKRRSRSTLFLSSGRPKLNSSPEAGAASHTVIQTRSATRRTSSTQDRAPEEPPSPLRTKDRSGEKQTRTWGDLCEMTMHIEGYVWQHILVRGGAGRGRPSLQQTTRGAGWGDTLGLLIGISIVIGSRHPVESKRRSVQTWWPSRTDAARSKSDARRPGIDTRICTTG